MKKLYNSLSIVLIVLSLSSCELGLDLLNPAGDIREVKRPIIGKITKIVVNDDVVVNVHFTNGEQYVLVKAGDNIIRDIKTSVADSTIEIRNNSSLTWTSSYKNKKEVTLYLNRNLTDLFYYGIGDVTILDTIKANTFQYYCKESSGSVRISLVVNTCNINQYSGISDLVIYGNCVNASINYKGTGWVYLQDFKTQNMVVTNNGTGDIFVNVASTLNATIKSIGNIRYIGSPEIVYVKDGKGNLVAN
jgi:hypothetical protein